MKPLRFAVLGCGYWSSYQIAGWQEVGGVQLVAVYNRTRAKAEVIAARFAVPNVYDDAEALLTHEQLDFLDIITDVSSHAQFVQLAAQHRVPVICQKPMAPDFATAEAMVRTCRDAGVPFMIHENWRWQRALRALKHTLAASDLGRPFRGRLMFNNSFPVLNNQPFLAELEQFILTDIGSHLLDTARFLFGEARRLSCLTQRIHPALKGEDVATVLLEMGDGVAVTCEMSYASRLEGEAFPETFALVECERGSVTLGPQGWIRVTTSEGTSAKQYLPPRYPWVDPPYAVVQAGIVSCHASLLEAIRTGVPPETSGEDNLKTMQLVFACYESAETGRTITV